MHLLNISRQRRTAKGILWDSDLYRGHKMLSNMVYWSGIRMNVTLTDFEYIFIYININDYIYL